ncbi:hypothetical protein SPI_02572 [Niveomyces insectorum RCEF 264]|uniref:Uncharacterized protein n=1 Tax=Niveomyces insectorum RCEF 264 TaxID=1081102 RepID=A0A167Y3H1_9HYPO|nr:hypothetical protein SPI_02572 [Niveomyces insectorum RCEF 264]
MRLFLFSTILLGLAVAAPAPVAAPASYDRRLPAIRGEPPVVKARRGEDAFAARPLIARASGTGTGTGVPLPTNTQAQWPTGTGSPTNTQAQWPTGTGSPTNTKAQWPTGTAATGTAPGTAASTGPTAGAKVAVAEEVPASYNFPSPKRAPVAKPAGALWWL